MENIHQYLRHRPHRLLLDSEPSDPDGSRSISSTAAARSSGTYNSEANFDTNMVIILAALLCALICALGLNSIVRCALRCSRRFAFESRDEAASSRLAAATGLKKTALRRIPVVIYGSSGMSLMATECAICLGEFTDGEKVRVLPNCDHGFHVRCIDTWLGSHSSCPTCRHSVLDQTQESSDQTGDHQHQHHHVGVRIHGSDDHLPNIVADEFG